MLIDKSFFGLKPFEILERAKELLEERNRKAKEIGRYTLSEGIINLLLENLRNYLVHGTPLKPGFGYASHPENFLEDLFWEAVINGNGTKIFKVKVQLDEFGGKPFFWIEEELPNYEFKEEPIEINELIEPGLPFRPSTIRETFQEIPLKIDWNEEDIALAADLILENGTYVFKTSKEGLIFQKIK